MTRVGPINRALAQLKRDPNETEQRILDECPEIDHAMSICLSAWNQLETCRYPGPMCAGPIPWTAIRDWTHEEGLDRQWLRVLAEVIHGLDVKRSNRISSQLKNKGKPDE